MYKSTFNIALPEGDHFSDWLNDPCTISLFESESSDFFRPPRSFNLPTNLGGRVLPPLIFLWEVLPPFKGVKLI